MASRGLRTPGMASPLPAQEREGTPESLVTGYFPHRLTATLAALKVVAGCLLVGLGTAAMVQQAGYSRQATGIWGGLVIIISGVLGAYAVSAEAWRYASSPWCPLLVVVIYLATGLDRDAA